MTLWLMGRPRTARLEVPVIPIDLIHAEQEAPEDPREPDRSAENNVHLFICVIHRMNTMRAIRY